MTELTPSSQPYFFGKDSFVPFVGQVEDVNDPKRSGRVKVRCVGWHPNSKEGDDGVTTEDLPWARVGYPTTHAQQSRIGGKHGLLPGSWVWGYFMDGDDAQDPFVVQTFNFTAKASDQDFRQDPQGKKGKLEKSDLAFDKIEVGGEQQPNIATRTPSEQGQKGYANPEDPSGDVTADESVDECTGEASRKSAAAVRRMEEKMKKGDKGNSEGQKYSVGIADGLCGGIAHARDDIKKKLEEMFPSQQSRFSYNDAVWNRYTGQFMDLNGIMAQLSLEISNVLKQPIQSLKAVKEEINRITKGTGLLIPDRDGVITQTADLLSTTIADLMHGIFSQIMIDGLFSLMMGMLTNMNNSGSGDNSDDGSSTNQGNQTGATPNTQISNNEALCLADTILINIEYMVEEALDLALEQATAQSGSYSSSSSSSSGAIASIAGSLASIMQFPLIQKYSIFSSIFNKAGPMSQDILTKDQGCGNVRQFATELGTMASLMGQSSGGSGGSSGGGSSSNNESPGNIDPRTIGFGGLPSSDTSSGVSFIPCEDATLEPTPDPGPDTGDGTVDGGGTGGGTGGGGTGGGTGGGGTGGGGDGGDIGGGTGGGIGGGGGTGGDIGGDIGGGTDVGTGTGGTEADPSPDDDSIASGVDSNGQIITPKGTGAIAVTVSLPSSQIVCGSNFANGIPNNVAIIDAGRYYFFNNRLTPDRAFPSIFIPGYNGVPVPVADRTTGELVAILTECGNYDFRHSRPKVTIIPDDSPVGITTDNPNYDIRLSGFFIENTGFDYTNPTITITDKDSEIQTASAGLVTSSGRIVEVDLINSGTNFRRIPDIQIVDETGFGAIVRPIMSVIARSEDVTDSIVTSTEVIFCPSKNQQNLS